ncbi:hypothetical protein [Photobacterium leiognathi]|uniref:hypothetical protein n=1 Tax=Photobacterium leiognathi TaxID=553611 RepID=UPI00020880DB|nr:hypothetical protein [Photobacterium leiognathi]PSW48323.1 hypothetical protein CTM83_20020 [Photobacterium leiognathi subsp. mandapamensis]GAA03243.1 hypothetical protein PMSV_4169 [Photobacterium leiognathi subsp. mandapamensis svers.1.1.]
MKSIKVFGIIAVVLLVIIIAMPSKTPEASISASKATFAQVDNDTGCTSKNSDEKKEVLFAENYEGKQFTWTGNVVLIKGNDVSLNLNDGALQDLTVTLQDKNAAFELQKDQQLTVKFIMKRQGGCVLPYRGMDGIIVK